MIRMGEFRGFEVTRREPGVAVVTLSRRCSPNGSRAERRDASAAPGLFLRGQLWPGVTVNSTVW
jgi:hypothetical protein